MQAGKSCLRFKNLVAVVIGGQLTFSRCLCFSTKGPYNVSGCTGGGSGLGKATSKRLAAEAAHVLVADIDLKAAERVAEDIADAGGSAETAQVRQLRSQAEIAEPLASSHRLQVSK